MFSPCLSALLIFEALFIYIVKFVSPCNTVVGVCALFIGGAGSTIEKLKKKKTVIYLP